MVYLNEEALLTAFNKVAFALLPSVRLGGSLAASGAG